MDKIKYNEKHEAYEITYNVWGKPTLVLFFTDDQQEILDNLSEIAVKLDKINSRKAKFAEIMIEGKWYNRSAHLFLEASELAEAIFAAYLFGMLRGLNYKMQGWEIQIPSQLLTMLPYIATIVVLIFIAMRKKKENQPPKALGESYFREER